VDISISNSITINCSMFYKIEFKNITSGILSIITPNTVIRRILKIVKGLNQKQSLISGGIYQVDELFTFIVKKIEV
jgi:hypothetical protein